MAEKFSILTTSYNHTPWLREWADALLCQSYSDIEVVFVDDASKLDDYKTAHSFEPEFKAKGIDLKIKRLNKNVGCATAYLHALRMATGDYFGVVDADDVLLPHAVDDIMRLYVMHPHIGWIYTQFSWCNRNLSKCRTGFCQAPPKGKNMLTAELGIVRHCYSHWRTFSRRVPDLESILCKGRKVSVDKYMGYRLEELSRGMFYDKICYQYRGDLKQGVTKQYNSLQAWKDVRADAMGRRRRLKIRKVYPIQRHKPLPSQKGLK